ncbi:MAG: trypsin-like peptidase domain-containing protein [Pyrinomonadaceae bacterium]
MVKGLVIHIAVGEDRHTEVLTSDHIRIGAGEDCDLRLRSSDLQTSPSDAALVLELARTNGKYLVTNFNHTLGIKHNGVPVESNSSIEDGDEILIGPNKLALQFFPIGAVPAIASGLRQETRVAPFIEHAAIESAATARRDDAKVFLREFTRELVREINTSTKIVTLVLALALIGVIFYFGLAIVKEFKQSRRTIDEQRAQLIQITQKLDNTQKKLDDVDESNQNIRNTLSLAVKLRSDFGGGVCLISGSFIFVEQGTGRPLRYPETQIGETGSPIQNGNEPMPLTPEGKGAIAEYEFVGTGFYVGDGFVLTNRHVAQPWLADERAQSLSSSVSGQPRLKKLLAYFPDHSQPVTLKFKMAAQRDDLAICTVDTNEMPAGVPVLPLEKDSDSVAVGKAVVMMGYPSGPDRLLALLDESEARGIQTRYGSLDSLLAYLADTKHIQPLTTQGNITDMSGRRIVYDARTAEGGSGAPLFGPSGKVIGVNFAVFTENTASNFAVPIRYGVTLLQKANWHAPESLEEEQNANSNSNQASARTTAAAASNTR